jgi:type IV pilus assembly protein PilA
MAPPPQKSGMSCGLVAAIVGGIIFVLIGPMAVMAIYGVRKYIATAKEAEARNALGQIGRDAVSAYEAEPAGRALCASASRSVPASAASIRGMKYQSSPADWNVDEATGAGFHCLKFSMDQPQYYMYSYHSTGSSFTATANGDLNGDGVLSTFTLGGHTDGKGTLDLDPSIRETNPAD